MKSKSWNPKAWSVVHCLLSAVSCQLSVVGLLWFVSCAKLGDPLPPVTTPLGTISDLEVVQVGDQTRVVFSLPPGEIRHIEIFRSCGTTLTVDETSEPVIRLEKSQLPRLSAEGKVVFEDQSDFDQSCSYGVRFLGRRGRRSPFSNIVRTAALVPARPPQNLTHELQEDRVILKWAPPTQNIDGSRPPHVVGYLINATQYVTDPEYTDRQFQFGQAISYQIQAVGQPENPTVLSDFSETLTFTPTDTFAPSTPQNVTALYLDQKVRILWNANREDDLLGYFIHKGTDPNRLEKSSSLITINTHQEESVTEGETYHYQVSAVDEAGNESPKSEVVSISIITAQRP